MEAEHPVIGYCGRLDMQTKGLDHLINGFSIYKLEGGRGQLWMVGDGADRAAVERMATDGGVQSDVKFFGSMSGTAKLRVLSNFDAFIHTSRREALPTACLEAASLGTPLVVSRETNLADCVEEAGAGLALDETSAGGVSRALGRVQALYHDNQLQSMGRNAQLLIEKQFSWEENARSFVAAIEAASHAT
jgi:glycosyltransferase involved in cell wall biosynthesis